jgi:hypothetical protein
LLCTLARSIVKFSFDPFDNASLFAAKIKESGFDRISQAFEVDTRQLVFSAIISQRFKPSVPADQPRGAALLHDFSGVTDDFPM